MSQNQPFPNLSFVGAVDYQPFMGSASDLLPREGFYNARIVKVAGVWSKTTPAKPMLEITTKILDEDAKDRTIITRVIYDGLDTNGNSLRKQWWDVMISTGTAVETVHGHAQAGTEFSLDQIIAHLTGNGGKVGVIEYVFKEYPKGRASGEVSGWVAPDRYKKQVESKNIRGMTLEDFQKTLVMKMTSGAVPGGVGAVNLGGVPPAAAAATPPVMAPAAMGVGVAAPAPTGAVSGIPIL